MTLFSHTPSRLSRLAATANLPLVAIVVSCLFSLLVILQHPLLNDDAYSYLRAAEVFNERGALAVLQSYGWYHYSIVIALLDKVLPGGLVATAHVFNTACYALLTCAFMLLCGELRASRRVQGFAALCILVMPLVNEMRYFLIRDTGYWAFALLSLVYLIRFGNSGRTRDALCWCLTLIAAIAFRLEGLLLLLAPLAILTGSALSAAERWQRCRRLLIVKLAVLGALLLLMLLLRVDLMALILYAYRWYLPLLADLSGTANATGTALFTPGNFPGSGNTTMNLLIAVLAYVLTLPFTLLLALTPPVVALLEYYRRHHSPLAPSLAGRYALIAYLGLATFALLLFLLIMHFLTQRYATLLALMLLSLAPLALDDLYSRAQQNDSTQRFHAILAAFCFYYVVGSLYTFGYSQRYIEDSIAWTQTKVPAAAQLRTNNFAIAYGSGLVTDYDKITHDAAGVVQASASGDTLVLDLKRDDNTEALDTNPLLLPVTSFANNRGDEVRIYQRR